MLRNAKLSELNHKFPYISWDVVNDGPVSWKTGKPSQVIVGVVGSYALRIQDSFGGYTVQVIPEHAKYLFDELDLPTPPTHKWDVPLVEAIPVAIEHIAAVHTRISEVHKRQAEEIREVGVTLAKALQEKPSEEK